MGRYVSKATTKKLNHKPGKGSKLIRLNCQIQGLKAATKTVAQAILLFFHKFQASKPRMNGNVMPNKAGTSLPARNGSLISHTPGRKTSTVNSAWRGVKGISRQNFQVPVKSAADIEKAFALTKYINSS